MTTTAIDSLSKKGSSQDLSYLITSKQFMVTPIRGASGTNNLEEQFLLGINYTETETEDNSTHVKTITKEYRNEDSTSTDYYTITSTIQPEPAAGYTTAFTETERHVLSYVSAAGTKSVAVKTISKKKDNNTTTTKVTITNTLAD